MNTPAEPLPHRRPLYAVLITVAVAAVCGRILSINAIYEPYLYAEPQQLKAYAERTAPRALTPLAAGNLLEQVGETTNIQWIKAKAVTALSN